MAVEVEMLTFPVPWWHWLIIGLCLCAAASAVLLILITVCCIKYHCDILTKKLLLLQWCCRCYALKKRSPNKVSYKELKTHSAFPLQESNKLQMQEPARQQLVRKVSRVNFQSRSNVSYEIRLLQELKQ